MEKELKEIVSLLKKILPLLIKNPQMMMGCDISQEEIENIRETKKISLEILQHVAGDTFFETYNEELNISLEEAKKVSKFLYLTAPDYHDKLHTLMPYIKK
jgi:hypothetical protein